MFDCSFVAQVVLLAKSLAVDLGNFMSLYSFQWNSEKKDKSVYRQTNQKIPTNNFVTKYQRAKKALKRMRAKILESMKKLICTESSP